MQKEHYLRYLQLFAADFRAIDFLHIDLFYFETHMLYSHKTKYMKVI